MGLFFLLGIIFFISPIFGAIASFIALYFYHDKKYKSIVCFFYLGLFLGLINSLKVQESDLINYFIMYTSGHNLSFFDYIFSFGKEPMFMVFNYVIYSLTSGSFELYLIIFTIVCYMLIFYSIWVVHKGVKLMPYSFIMAISVAFFFPNIFLLSAHLMRQFMAASLILFLVVNFIFNKKKGYVYFLIAVLIHSTSLLFGFLFLPLFKKRISDRKIFIFSGFFGIILLVFFKFSGILLSVFENIPVLSYVFYRLDSTAVAWETDNLGVLNFLLQLFVVFVFYKVTKLVGLRKFQLIQVLYILSLILLMFVAVNYNNTELALRFSFYMYFLFPLSIYFLPLLIRKKESFNLQKILFLFMFVLFGAWFLLKLNFGAWTFNNLELLLFYYDV